MLRRSMIVALLCWVPPYAGADPPRACTVLEDFASSPAGSFPLRWEIRPASAQWIYRVLVENGLHFLRAGARKTGIAAGTRTQWDLRKNPILCWKWRPRVFPRGADERDGKNDSVLAVYVGFEHKWGVLKYHWSERLALGTELNFPPFGRTKMHVSGSGVPADRDQWVDVCVDVESDYRRRYGEREADQTKGVGVLSDADDTDSYAEGDYADFRVCTR
jgi:hypothetical protein